MQLANFTAMAKGSCYELEAQLLLARELSYGALDKFHHSQALCNEVGRMLHSMLNKLQSPENPPQPRT
jgi:four helix bundle protein